MKAVVALILLSILPFCHGDAYVDDSAPPIKTEYGMSRARTPTYEYEFDPEIFSGYTRQDNFENGTAVGAGGELLNFVVTKNRNKIFLRIDGRDCSKNEKDKPKACICYESAAAKEANPICNGKKMAHVCQREKKTTEVSTGYLKDGVSFTKNDGSVQKGLAFKDKSNNEAYVESLHVTIDRKSKIVEYTGTNYLGNGLHMANVNDRKQYIQFLDVNFFFSDTVGPGAMPEIKKKYFLNRGQVEVMEIYFPKDGCARVDYCGLAFAGDLVSDEPKQIDPYKPKPLDGLQQCNYCPSCDA